ncbi:hypothetical protein [Nostoc favosum]|uniref:hypothetical protein n=1 Tax=Nostoc favosum TaxID=2907819 RepID=UPI001E333928|nr:hypothetical protein [Nostoc favosum]
MTKQYTCYAPKIKECDGSSARRRHRPQALARRIEEPTHYVQPFQDSTPWILGIARLSLHPILFNN